MSDVLERFTNDGFVERCETWDEGWFVKLGTWKRDKLRGAALRSLGIELAGYEPLDIFRAPFVRGYVYEAPAIGGCDPDWTVLRFSREPVEGGEPASWLEL